MSRQYNGSCHCGAVKFSFEGEEITSGLRCTCSICVRKAALMSPYTLAPDNLVVEADSSDLGLYQFGTMKAKHHFCRNCGIYTHHETARMPGQYRVNLGCIDDIDTFALNVDVFDGKNKL